MKGSPTRVLAVVVCLLRVAAAAPRQTEIELTRLDDFEDASPWLKGDPNTDLEQKDAAVTTSKEFVKEGQQSLAFMVRVNWTQRPNEKYAKGWPMVRRKFKEAQDWSAYDYVYFWLYAKTECDLLQSPVLRIGFPDVETKALRTWYTIPGIKPNQWQEVAVPLTLQADWKRVVGVSFYVAEAWYRDGDAIDFFIDDMRLAKRLVPAISVCSMTSRTFPRGQGVGVRMRIEGPHEGANLRFRITDLSAKEQFASSRRLTDKEQHLVFRTKGLPPGGHYGLVELLDSAGRVVDSRRNYFRSRQPGKRSYLKLITFYTKPVMACQADVLRVLNDSAYAGVAIPLLGSYDTDPVPGYDSLKPQIEMIREALTIDPWPWVVLNRILGAPADGSGHAHGRAKNVEYFTRIRGMDLDNETGARGDMMQLWRYAVRMAREWRSPGIMIDLEAYNHYRAYSVPHMAKERDESIDTVIAKCEKLGADLGRIIQEEYPTCIVWSLFSRLERSTMLPGRDEPLHTTPSYITLGLLKYAKENDVPLKYVCGGETTPGYCNKSVEILKRKIAARDCDVAPFLEQFPDRFSLAGTISPFHDYSIATSFIQKGYDGSSFKTIGDFEPMFRTLFDAYDWVWIYASSAAKTMPYRPENSRLYSDVLRAALESSVGGR